MGVTPVYTGEGPRFREGMLSLGASPRHLVILTIARTYEGLKKRRGPHPAPTFVTFVGLNPREGTPTRE